MQTFYDADLDLQINGNMKFDPKKYAYSFQAALDMIKRIENGEIVNHTSVKAESEDRPVDHYNLRMKEEKVAGKSLAHTLKQWEEVQKFVQGQKCKHVIFNGIGGSYLGPFMLLTAIYGDEYNAVQAREGRPELHFVANTDSDSFSQLFHIIDIKETLMVVISKSGSTAETATNTNVFSELCTKAGLNPADHMCAVTIHGSNLYKKAIEQKWCGCFEMNEATGGRTSICSAVSMVSCAFSNIDFSQFVKGMSQMDEATRREDYQRNPALIISALIDNYLQKSSVPKNMIILGYSDALKQYYHYCQQLYMESLGKEYTIDGRYGPKGLTVYGGIGTAEQHAFMQQIQKGANDSFVKFI